MKKDCANFDILTSDNKEPNCDNTPENLIENGLNLSQLNQYMNKKNIDCVASPPFLLSRSEVKAIWKSCDCEALPSDLLSSSTHWWLRSPGATDDNASVVFYDGLSINNYSVHYDLGVRPVFNIENSEVLNLAIGDKIKIADIPCTVILIKDGKATSLCDDVLFESPFNKDPNKGNDYETSDVKQELENYFKYSIFEVEIVKTKNLDDILKKLKSDSEVLNYSEGIPRGR